MVDTHSMIPVVKKEFVLPMNKKYFTLAVTAFTHRILLARYGQPIRASRQYNRELFTLLQLAPIRALSEERCQSLSRQAFFTIGPALRSALMERDIAAIGMAMHEHFIREMYLHTHSQVIAGRKAWTALEDFYIMHGLTEEDWKFETAYRKWLTYSTQVEKRAGIEKTVNCRPSQNVRSTVYILIAELDGWKITNEQIKEVLFEALKIPARDAKLIHAFLLQQLLCLDPPAIARRLGYSRQNAYARLEVIQNRLNGATLTGRRIVQVLSHLKTAVQRKPDLFL